ncbi:microcystin-dependent protein [Acidovorax sp. 93]|jgi:microcystin-dependent protein|uniref:phage tail protein n=1 Tax=Acidovorax sp. 93 TaxID=2135632 RepID=UPI000EB608BE|nr:tail fiber protein [Acidovorax sp. 93]RKR25994.1 microcystin-dependent protein [Acidovorax sp. 93]
MSNPFLGEIRMFGGTFAPAGWAFCNGQLIAISQNSALFALLGTTYGGNGQTTFGLPDLRGRVPMGQGQGPGLSYRNLGEVTGIENVTLLSTNLPAHTHTVSLSSPATTSLGTLMEPGPGAIPAASNQRNAQYAPSASANTQLPVSTGNTTSAGNNSPVSVMQPSLAVSFIIALQGIFPSRN